MFPSAVQLNAPPFPPFVRTLVKDGECYGWGAFGWMLNSGKINVKPYNYFVLVDASVRGPFIAPYVPVCLLPSPLTFETSSPYLDCRVWKMKRSLWRN